jgi:hypothetical protein
MVRWGPTCKNEMWARMNCYRSVGRAAVRHKIERYRARLRMVINVPDAPLKTGDVPMVVYDHEFTVRFLFVDGTAIDISWRDIMDDKPLWRRRAERIAWEIAYRELNLMLSDRMQNEQEWLFKSGGPDDWLR